MTTAEVYPGPPPVTAFEAPAGGPPWDIGNSVAAPHLSARARKRYDLLNWLWKHSSLEGLHHCRLHCTGACATLHRGQHCAHWSGLQTCKSIWACPVCSARIRTERAAIIERAAKAWVDRFSGQLGFLTLTLRHALGQPLRALRRALSAAWRRIAQSRWWRSLGVFGWFRSVEVTWGRNGWHPHLHILLLVPAGFDLEALGSEVGRRWQQSVTAQGLAPTTLERGARLQPVSVGGESMARYLSKVLDEAGEEWDVGAELARSDVKRSRKGMSPMQLLEAAAAGDGAAVARWHEYEQGTKGARCIESSRGLAAALGLDEIDATDESLLEERPETEPVLTVTAQEYTRLARAGVHLDLVDLANAASDEAVRWYAARALEGASP